VRFGDLVDRVRCWFQPDRLPVAIARTDQAPSDTATDPGVDTQAALVMLAPAAAEEPREETSGAPNEAAIDVPEATPWPAGLERLSQDLRSSLSVIDGFSALLLQETVGPLNALQRDFVRTIQQEGARMASRVQALAGGPFEASELELPDCPVQALSPIVRELVARLEPLSFRKGVQLQTDLPMDLPPVGVASSQLRQLLGSVLDHMIAEAGAAGRLVVRARAAGAEVEVCLEASGSSSDVGGVQAGGRIVGPPVLHSNERASLGPGLAASRQLVDQHGGRMWIERSPERADRLLFTLPAVCEPARREPVGAGL
jgi:signal transduction histidine kinase